MGSVQIKSGASSDLLTIDPTSKAARVTPYLPDATLYPIARQTYSTFGLGLASYVTAYDIFALTGSASKTVKVLRMFMSTIQTTAGVNYWYITLRSTANSSENRSTTTLVPHDSNNNAATAVGYYWTAAPNSFGSAVGQVWAGYVNSPAAATAGIGSFIGVCVDFTELYGQPITLRGAAYQLSWNFNHVAQPAGLLATCGCTWTEE
jgi:hypothetical protein